MEVPADGVPQPPSSSAGAAAGASTALPLSPVVQRVQHLGEGSRFSHSCVMFNKDPTAPFFAMKTSPTPAGVVLHPLVLVVSQGQV